ncbi:MAG: long-chain fatty acid--CoA ligase [Bacillota bacterium]
MEKTWLKYYDPGVPPTIEYPGYPLFSMLEQAARASGDLTALVYRGGSLRYASLLEQTERFAAALHDLGLAQGDRIAIQLPTCPQFVIAYYAAIKLGAVAVPLNPLLVAREMVYYLNDSKAALLITAEDSYSYVKQYQDKTGVKSVIASSLEHPGGTAGRLLGRPKNRGTIVTGEHSDHRMEKLLLTRPHPPRVTPRAADPAVIMYSAGSSGKPMGAVLTHGNLVANVIQCRCWNPSLKDNGGETVLVALPLSHSYGMTIGMNLGLAVAGRLVLVSRFDTMEILNLIEKSGVTYFPGVPAMFEAILKSPDLRKYNLRSIKTCLSGGAPLPLAMQQSFEQVTGGKLIEGYGLAEASPVTHSNPYLGKRRAGSIGLPLPDTEIKVVDLHREELTLPAGAVGELCIKGPQVMQGYINAPEETAAVLKNGWLHTGDIVRVEEDGFTYIVDRKKDLIISDGYNVYPAEVQAVLLAHPLISEARVSARRDPYKGESLHAVVAPVPHAALSEAEVLRYCRENLAAYKLPKQIEVL